MFLSTVLVLMVWSVFLAQNELYEDVVRRSEVHDHARSVVNLVVGEVRPATDGAFVVAGSDQLVLREPLSMGFVCDVQGNRVTVYLPRTSAGLDSVNVTGYGVRDSGGVWRYYADTWSSMSSGSGQSYANTCESVGFDIDGLDASHFHRLDGPGSTPSPRPEIGDALMLVRALELRFADSTLDPGYTALYRGTYGETLVEFATGLSPESSFAYSLENDDAFQAQITGGDLDLVDAVRIIAVAVAAQDAEGLRPYEYELVRDAYVRNGTDGS